MQAVERGVALGRVELAFLHQAVEPLLDVVDAAVEKLVVDLSQRHVETTGDGCLGNARPHQTGTGNVQLFDRHAFSFSTSRAITNRWISLVPS